jgi:divalent metal cation (Fe/Co/Zn/Cd) transporter
MAAERNWLRFGLGLVTATLAYNVLEAFVALWFGAEAASIALFGFGLDSIIECAAAAVLLWRLGVEAHGADAEKVERTERRVHRFIGVTFLLLALYITAQATLTLIQAVPPQGTMVGIVLAAFSLVVMPLVAWGKLRAARRIPSAALAAEAKETLACAGLSLTLFLGLSLNAWIGWWWADPVAALAMVPWLVREGLEGLSGEGSSNERDLSP